MKSRVLVVVPIKPTLNEQLKAKSVQRAMAMLGGNPTLELGIFYDASSEPRHPTDGTAWSKVSRVRNRIVEATNLDRWDYLFWVDADVVEYPPDLPTHLIARNPRGVSAPMVFIEGGNVFYDWAAFIIAGRDHVEPSNPANLVGRNLQHAAPYWLGTPEETDVAMDCVGTVTMVPTSIYKAGVRYTDHPAFTDHHPICKACRDAGNKVIVCRDLVAYHADLPKYAGEAWH